MDATKKEVAEFIDEHLPAAIPAPNVKKRGAAKGSKHKITALKLIAEEAARGRNADRIQYVIDVIISDAARGSFAAQRLVWNAVMSQGIPNEAKSAENVQINIGTTYKVTEPDIKIIPTDVTPEEVKDEEQHDS
jgi:hypothetical protein